MNKLYFGDNLEIMREMPSNSVDLICTDPPFNSGRTYNIFLGDSLAQKKVFGDIWFWDDAAQNTRDDIKLRIGESEQYSALDYCLQGLDFVLGDPFNKAAVKGNKGAMRSYLTFMGPRLVELHRLLKDTGTIYLHCDPSASHYLKIIMDAIWDTKNGTKNQYFKNEVIWHYPNRLSQKGFPFPKMHDNILVYSSSDKFVKKEIMDEDWKPSDAQIKRQNRGYDWYKGQLIVYDETKTRNSGIDLDKIDYKKGKTGRKRVNSVWIKDALGSIAKERLKYPTQKPRSIYERMIKASSNPGNIVMDPFCGCGTTIDAAHTLKRNWIGIDLTILALDPIEDRLRGRHGLNMYKDYEMEGYPTNMQEVMKLVKDHKKHHDFANWAVTRIGLKPTQNVADGGKDGVGQIEFWDKKLNKLIPKRMLAEVKTGKPTLGNVRDFCRTMDKEDAILGIFITIEPVTRGMKQEAQSMGNFEHNGINYPRLQFWQVDDNYFDNPQLLKQIIKLPREWIKDPTPKSERHFDDQQEELSFDKITR